MFVNFLHLQNSVFKNIQKELIMTTAALMDQYKTQGQQAEAAKPNITFKELKWEPYIVSDKVLSLIHI